MLHPISAGRQSGSPLVSSFRVVRESISARNHQSPLGSVSARVNPRSDQSSPCKPDARTCTQYPESLPWTRTARCNISYRYGRYNSDARTSSFHQTYFLFSTTRLIRDPIGTQQHSSSTSRGLAFPTPPSAARRNRLTASSKRAPPTIRQE